MERGAARVFPDLRQPQTRFHQLRWVFAGLLLLASALNYVDRQALSILAPTIQRDLHISDGQYGSVIQVFLLAYAVMYVVSGRIVDRISTRVAEAAFLTWWSIAGILTALIKGFGSLLAVRSLLGLAEPGNYTASAKVVAEWFPVSERGTAVGLYSMGGTIGAAIAAPLVAFLTIRYGWRSAFVGTGAAGLVLVIVWLAVYRVPAQCRWLSARERAVIEQDTLAGPVDGVTEDGSVALQSTASVGPSIVKSRAFWALVLVRMTTDPVWYFYLFWFPKYLQEVRGMSLASVGRLLWLMFVAADAGSFVGGIAAARRIRRGASPVSSRMRIMVFAAVVPCFTFVIPRMPGYVLPLVGGCCAAFAHMAWMTNATTLPIDIFPAGMIGSVQGAIGALSSVAAFISTGLIAFAVTHLSYRPVFYVASILYPLSLIALAQIPRVGPKGANVSL
jgi:ACS family hexuronate transporter-like MFS transporter